MNNYCELPYPSTKYITRDERSAKIISPAYASRDSELTAILLYSYQHIIFENKEMEEEAETLSHISMDEMRHIELLGETLLALGVIPIYTERPPCKMNFYSTQFVPYSIVTQKMLMDDLRGEMTAIQMYKDMLSKLDNDNVAAIIERILLDEKSHYAEFARLLAKSNT